MMESGSVIEISKSLEQRIAREFRKSFFQDWDKQFITILFFSLLIEIVVVVYLSRRPVPEYSEKEIARIQERFANFVLGETTAPTEEAVVSSSETVGTVGAEGVASGTVSGEGGSGTGSGSGGGGEGSGGGEGAGTGTGGGVGLATSSSAIEARRQSREAISREVSNKGLLGLLTGSGTAVEGEAVSSLFSGPGGGVGVGDDLDQVLASASGLKTQGASGLGSGGGGGGSGGDGGGGGGEIRGGRSGDQATIDDLVSDLGTVSSQSLTRRGEIQVEAPAEVEGEGRRSAYRSLEAISEVMYSHLSAITYCYERELRKIPDLKGKISIRITVSPNGSVKSADIVSSTMNNESAERCILARIRLWDDFPPIDDSEGDVTFIQPYIFGY
ncbi:AgmX/PglI C-terminal domain-containing protein [bacterium]|nr:AgmX/PglI C-terminal domain-containing protein [bacterium]